MKKSVLFLFLNVLLLILLQASATATLKFKRETGKSCTFCHVEVPKQGSKDPLLNEEGQMFKANDYKLTEEQKKKPQHAFSTQ